MTRRALAVENAGRGGEPFLQQAEPGGELPRTPLDALAPALPQRRVLKLHEQPHRSVVDRRPMAAFETVRREPVRRANSAVGRHWRAGAQNSGPICRVRQTKLRAASSVPQEKADLFEEAIGSRLMLQEQMVSTGRR